METGTEIVILLVILLIIYVVYQRAKSNPEGVIGRIVRKIGCGKRK